jgi:ubiquinone/menaquinone biosynthesis C-methylase UbiE
VSRKTDYRPIAPVFDRRYHRNNYADTERALHHFLASPGHVDVLDVGCGTGHWIGQLGSGRHRIVGVDASAEMLQEAAMRGPFELVRAAAEALPFGIGAFDRIFCLNSFHHFTDKRAFVQEARRLLRRGGGVITIGLDPHSGLDKWWVYDYFENALELDRQRYLPGKAIRAMLADAGFKDCRTDVAQSFRGAIPARLGLERGRLAKTVTSQLAILTDDEYNRGLQRIQEDLRAAESSGREFSLISDVRLYATTGWLS